jgi:hypothetical protein
MFRMSVTVPPLPNISSWHEQGKIYCPKYQALVLNLVGLPHILFSPQNILSDNQNISLVLEG